MPNFIRFSYFSAAIPQAQDWNSTMSASPRENRQRLLIFSPQLSTSAQIDRPSLSAPFAKFTFQHIQQMRKRRETNRLSVLIKAHETVGPWIEKTISALTLKGEGPISKNK